MDVAAGREVHHRVAAPADRPHQLLDLVRRTRGDRGIADVGVDLHQEVAADDDRFEFRMVDVGGDDGAAAGDLVADEFRGDEFGDFGAEVLAVGSAFGRTVQRLLPTQVLAVRDVDHLLGDDAGAGEFELRDRLARLAAEHRMIGRAGGDEPVAGGAAIVHILHRAGGDARKAAFRNPPGAQRRQAGLQVDGDRGIGVGAGGVVGAIGFLARGGIERDLAERHVDVGTAHRRGVDLARAGDRAGGDAARTRGGLRLDGHGRLLNRTRGRCRRRTGERLRRHPSLRRHDPVQVQGSPRRRVVRSWRSLSPLRRGSPR